MKELQTQHDLYPLANFYSPRLVSSSTLFLFGSSSRHGELNYHTHTCNFNPQKYVMVKKFQNWVCGGGCIYKMVKI